MGSFLKAFGLKKGPTICPHLIWGQISLQTYGPKCAGSDLSPPVTRDQVLKLCMGQPSKCSIYPIARRIPWATHPPYVFENPEALSEVKKWLEGR